MRPEITESITATVLARNMAQTIDNVRMTRTSVLITKGTKVIAKLSPPPKKGLSVNGLVELLKSLPKLSANDSLQMSENIKMVRAAAKLPENPWE